MKMKLVVIAALAVSLVPEARAQSALSVQGFGYPLGGLSTRALAVGGATAEIDPLSTLNPATLSAWGYAGLAAQFAPERRHVRGPDGTFTTTTVRFPVFAAGMPLANKWMLGISSSTFLDRSWSTRFESSQVVAGQTVNSSTLWSSRGAINDVRLAVAYRVTPKLSAGAALHVITGVNDITIATDYTGSDFVDLSLSTSLGYSGRAYSGGLTWNPSSVLSLGVSARKGASMASKRNKVEVGSADFPDRYGATVAFTGLPGTVIAVRYDKVAFSSLNGLGTDEAVAHDTREIGAGAEFGGPHLLGLPSVFRVGYRDRGLPYEAAGSPVMEKSFSAGLGLSVTRTGREGAMFDFGIMRLTRDNNSTFRESAWVFGAGILVRP